MSTATVTRRLRAEGLPLELVRGAGYHYFIFDDGVRYDTLSIMVPRFRDIPIETWLTDGRNFAADVERRFPDASAEAWKPGQPIKLRKGR